MRNPVWLQTYILRPSLANTVMSRMLAVAEEDLDMDDSTLIFRFHCYLNTKLIIS